MSDELTTETSTYDEETGLITPHQRLTPLGGWCPIRRNPTKHTAGGTVPHQWRPMGNGWLRCTQCGARQNRAEPIASSSTTSDIVKSLSDALTATRDRLATVEEDRALQTRILDRLSDRLETDDLDVMVARIEELQTQARDALDLDGELRQEREERRTLGRRVAELESQASEHAVIKMRVAWGQRLLFFLSATGFLGLWKLYTLMF